MKRAQQAMETIMVVAILAILLFIGIWVYAQLTESSVEEQEDRILQEQLFSIALQLSHLPELSCVKEGGETRTCIDTIKMDLFHKAMHDTSNDLYDDQTFLRYVDLFGRVHIEVQPLYPEMREAYVLLSTNTTTDARAQSFPIILHNPITNMNEFGIIWVYKQ